MPCKIQQRGQGCLFVCSCWPPTKSIFAYGAGSRLVLLDTSGPLPKVTGTLCGHRLQERVTGVSINPHAQADNVCVSCGSDGQVHVWDLVVHTVI